MAWSSISTLGAGVAMQELLASLPSLSAGSLEPQGISSASFAFVRFGLEKFLKV